LASTNDIPPRHPISRIPAKSFVARNPRFAPAEAPTSQFVLTDLGVFCRTAAEGLCTTRLNSAIGYITPKEMLAGHQQAIQAQRDRKLEAAREHPQNRCQRTA
jgi:hypothetical protein